MVLGLALESWTSGAVAKVVESIRAQISYRCCVVGPLPSNPRSPGTHIVGSWVIDRISLYREQRTGTQYIGIWASRLRAEVQQLVYLLAP